MVKVKEFLYLVAFVEGAGVMAVELAGAKMIAPFYGTSLYVWAAVLAVTLGGLTTGYFLGGWATSRFDAHKTLRWILAISTVFIALMPVIALQVMPATSGLGLRVGSLVASLLTIFIPLVCLGMVSPTIIHINNTALKGTGKTAGTVYAISTIGGILMTLLMGFYMLPSWGIRHSVLLTACSLGLMLFILVWLQRQSKTPIILSILGLIVVFLGSRKPFTDPKIPTQFLYRSEGILGQLSVLSAFDDDHNPIRMLYLNQIAQTFVRTDLIPVSSWYYPHRLSTMASIKPMASRALLIGMGGGSLAMEFKQLGFKLDIVEIDERIPSVAQQFFGFDPTDVRIVIDDGRHYIRRTEHKYDIIALDVLNGENQPFHLFTTEAFRELKTIVNDSSMILINFQGNLFAKEGKAARSIYRTLKESGFNVQYFVSGENFTGEDVTFIASLGSLDFRQISNSRLNPCCKKYTHTYEDLITEKEIELHDAELLTDDKPQFESFNTYYNESWRKENIGALLNLKENKIPFFY
jgi:spermidine synthase